MTPGGSGMTPDDTLYHWCKRYVTSNDYAEAHPEDPYGDAELDYCEDNLRRHLQQREASQ